MKGLVEVTADHIIDLAAKCTTHLNNPEKFGKVVKYTEFSFLKMRNIEKTYINMPSWHYHRNELIDWFFDTTRAVQEAEENGCKFYLSQLSYTHLVKLSDGDRDANSIFIMDY